MFPRIWMPVVGSLGLKEGSKNRWTAEAMPWIWVIVPVPKSPAQMPNAANSTASGFHLVPSPRSM